ncbi:hypothetical protein [Streptomyces sp. NPDC127084]|uniref:hypothetical protein n=1 Tax=Streptomyces sp. NPDC127084 TaxID=3347133 RepID=UPI003657E6CC
MTELDTTPSVPTPEGSPLYVSAEPAAAGGGNLVAWHGLDASSPEAAGGWRVYRWNPATASYEKLVELPAGAADYLDTGAERGTTSYYWVTAVAADGTESLPGSGWAVSAPGAGV